MFSGLLVARLSVEPTVKEAREKLDAIDESDKGEA